MFKNYFKVAFRNMLKRKGYTLLNMLGLAIGMAVCLLIVLFVQGELSFDRFHEKGDRIYRVALERQYPGRSTSYAIIPLSIGEAIKNEFPEVEQNLRLFNAAQGAGSFVKIGDRIFNEDKVYFADSNFFHVFTIPMVQGSGATALDHVNSVVLTETVAEKYFGSPAAAMGKTILLDDSVELITGVCKDMPGNAHFDFDFLVSAASLGNANLQPNYVGFSAYTYLLLKPGANAKALEAKLPQIVEKYVSGAIEQNFGVTYKEFLAQGNGYHYYLQPVPAIHLTSHLEWEMSPSGSLGIVYAFSIIALFILFLACINFVNLSTARSLDRAKEVGIRKTFGSERKELIFQFLFESITLSYISMIIAILITALAVPFFNSIFQTHLGMMALLSPLPILALLVAPLIIGTLAGLYPAFILSSFQPIVVLKGKFSFNPRGRFVRNGLVVFQFAISVILIISTLVVNRQMQYMLSDELGFKKDHVIVLKRTDQLALQTPSFKNDLYKIPGVVNVSSTSALPGEANFFGTTLQELSSKKTLTGRGLIVDSRYLSTLDITMEQGRFFSADLATDSLAVVLNESAVEEFGLTNPLGAQIITHDGLFALPDGTPQTLTVVGVVKDFHFQSLHQKISPLVIMNSSKFHDQMPAMAVRIEAAQFKGVVASIGALWKQYVPEHPFQFSFLDQQLAELYHAEETTQQLFTIFSLLAVFIACMGLFGLITYATQKRAREIGIRKVLGASLSSVIALLSRDFLRLVLMASAIALPVAWLTMNKWLQDFAYRINMSWWIFGIGIGGALLIALLTVSLQTVKAALANPVKSLRTE